jgi:hypothetical protein
MNESYYNKTKYMRLAEKDAYDAEQLASSEAFDAMIAAAEAELTAKRQTRAVQYFMDGSVHPENCGCC